MSADLDQFKARREALRLAQRRLSGVRSNAQAVGVLLAIVPWHLAAAPWWAMPVFMVSIGFFFGRVAQAIAWGRIVGPVKAAYPDMKL